MPDKKCQTCGKKAHDFSKEEAFDCVPPRDVLDFGSVHIPKDYRLELYEEYPFYTTEEVVGSYLGHNPYFPGYEDWFDGDTTTDKSSVDSFGSSDDSFSSSSDDSFSSSSDDSFSSSSDDSC